MEENTNSNYSLPTAFYDKYIHDDENIQAKIKPILNQIHESRVIVKELHIQYGERFSGMMNSYRNRLEDLKDHYDTLISELQTREKSILDACKELLKDEK